MITILKCDTFVAKKEFLVQTIFIKHCLELYHKWYSVLCSGGKAQTGLKKGWCKDDLWEKKVVRKSGNQKNQNKRLEKERKDFNLTNLMTKFKHPTVSRKTKLTGSNRLEVYPDNKCLFFVREWWAPKM